MKFLKKENENEEKTNKGQWRNRVERDKRRCREEQHRCRRCCQLEWDGTNLHRIQSSSFWTEHSLFFALHSSLLQRFIKVFTIILVCSNSPIYAHG